MINVFVGGVILGALIMLIGFCASYLLWELKANRR